MGQKLFIFLIVLLFLYVASPLLLPLAMGAVLAVLFFPWLRRLEDRNLSTVRASALLTTGVTLVFLLPISILLFLGAKAGFHQFRIWRDAPRAAGGSFVQNIMESPSIQRLIEKITVWYPVEVSELVETLEEIGKTIGLKFADILGSLFAQLPSMTMGLVIMVISIYFSLVDGRKIVYFLRRHTIFSPTHTEKLLRYFAGMCRSVILATVVSGLVQSFIYTIACLVTGVGSAFMIGFFIFLGSFIPLVGALPLTAGVALREVLTGNTTIGIVLLVVAGLVSVVDNLIRPIVLKGAGNLHPLLAFVAAFGGLQIFGFSGVFLGPIIAGLLMVTIEIIVDGKEVG